MVKLFVPESLGANKVQRLAVVEKSAGCCGWLFLGRRSSLRDLIECLICLLDCCVVSCGMGMRAFLTRTRGHICVLHISSPQGRKVRVRKAVERIIRVALTILQGITPARNVCCLGKAVKTVPSSSTNRCAC